METDMKTPTIHQINAGEHKRREAIRTYSSLLDAPNDVRLEEADGYLVRTMAYGRAMRAGLSHTINYAAAQRDANL